MNRNQVMLSEFWEKLNKFNWYYDFSDDSKIWDRGKLTHRELAAIAKISPEHQTLYNKFTKHAYSGRAWGNEKVPKPARP
jgi:hypothetical protein